MKHYQGQIEEIDACLMFAHSVCRDCPAYGPGERCNEVGPANLMNDDWWRCGAWRAALARKESARLVGEGVHWG